MAKSENPVKFTRVFKNDDGTIDTWYYDTSITTSGPVKVEIEWIKSLKPTKIPLSQQKFIHPVKGTEISYARAKSLGII